MVVVNLVAGGGERLMRDALGYLIGLLLAGAVLGFESDGLAQPMGDPPSAPSPLAPLLPAAVGAAPVSLEWRVLDRFRLFYAEPRPIDRISATTQSAVDAWIAQINQIDPLGPAEAAADFAGSYDVITNFLQTPQVIGGGIADLPYRRTRWLGAQSGAASLQPANRRYEADYLYPKTYWIAARLVGAAAGVQCAWSADGLPAFAAPCDAEVTIPVRALAANASNLAGGIAARTTLNVVINAMGPVPVIPPTQIEVRDRLIISLGDSYASGEGNPDRPTSLSALGPPPAWDTESAERWWLDPLFLNRMKPAAWTDGWCHRSLMSQHFVAALVFAARHPKEAVTYASFACSGAALFDGVLAPQKLPPGKPEFPPLPANSDYQLRSVIRLLCAGELPGSRVAPAALLSQAARFKLKAQDVSWASVAPNCPSGRKARRVDTLLVSLGGNDVGFSGVISDALLPRKEPPVSNTLTGSWAVDIVRGQAKAQTPEDANRIINNALTRSYGMLNLALKSTFGPATSVVQATYPNPLRQVGMVPGTTELCAGFGANTAYGAMHGLFPDRNLAPDQRWRLSIDQDEADKAEAAVFGPLNDTIRANRALPGWTVIDGYQSRFLTHGWCAKGPNEPKADFPFWRLEATGLSNWTPYAPKDWKPYGRQARWFRTANDAVLTQISNLNGSLVPAAISSPTVEQFFTSLLKLSGAYTSFLENGPASAITGSFHPTFAGHVAMGIEAARAMESLPR